VTVSFASHKKGITDGVKVNFHSFFTSALEGDESLTLSSGEVSLLTHFLLVTLVGSVISLTTTDGSLLKKQSQCTCPEMNPSHPDSTVRL